MVRRRDAKLLALAPMVALAEIRGAGADLVCQADNNCPPRTCSIAGVCITSGKVRRRTERGARDCYCCSFGRTKRCFEARRVDRR